MEQPRITGRFCGDSASTGTSPLLRSSPNFDLRSPVTPRISTRCAAESINDHERLHRITDSLSSSSAPASSPESSSSAELPPSEFRFQLPQNNSKTRRSRRWKPKALRVNSPGKNGSDSSTEDEMFPPRSAFAVTPSLIHPRSHTKHPLGTFSAINLILGKTIGVGVYSVPSSIFSGVGSVGMTILVWTVGAAISFCGLAVYLDLGSALPQSGGERVYLERIFRRPKMLATCMYMSYVVILGFSTPNCIVLGEYAIHVLDGHASTLNVRAIAVTAITASCLLHARFPSVGLHAINVLGVGKMVILLAVIVSGVASIGQGNNNNPTTAQSTAHRNFSDLWTGSSSKPYDYATALLKVLYCFRGYSTANQVLSEVRDPTHTLKLAGAIALSIASAGYILANIAYFCVVEKDDFRKSGVVVASIFLRNIFGPLLGERILPLFIIFSAFGNIAATSFAQARVNQELGAQDLLPCSHLFRSVNSRGAPGAGLFLHWLISVLVIVLPPPGEIYNFLVEIGGYPVSVLSVAIAGGLLYLQLSPRERWQSPCPAKKGYTIVFLASNLLLLVFPWLDPGRHSACPPEMMHKTFVYYAYPATSLAVLATGGLYWVYWMNVKQPVSRMWDRKSDEPSFSLTETSYNLVGNNRQSTSDVRMMETDHHHIVPSST